LTPPEQPQGLLDVSDADWLHDAAPIGRRIEPDFTLLDYICGHAPATVGREYGAPELKDMARIIERFPRYEIGDNARE
jgi:hypothetical protein